LITWHQVVGTFTTPLYAITIGRDLVPACDVVTINAPLHPETEGLFDDILLASMKRGAYLINTARAKICDRDAIVRALQSGQLAGYAGDVWYPQPAPPAAPSATSTSSSTGASSPAPAPTPTAREHDGCHLAGVYYWLTSGD
jgi:lactate dehydrogenase-like 2-hydroxyacid dehydrogenase